MKEVKEDIDSRLRISGMTEEGGQSKVRVSTAGFLQR